MDAEPVQLINIASSALIDPKNSSTTTSDARPSDDPYSSAIKEQADVQLKIADYCYNITVKLYSDDEIRICAEEIVIKEQYAKTYKPKDIMVLTQSAKSEQSSEEFYKILVTGLMGQKPEEIRAQGSITDTNILLIKIIVNYSVLGLQPRTFPLYLQNVPQDDVKRMEKMMMDFNKKNELHENRMVEIKQRLDSLSAKIDNIAEQQNNLVSEYGDDDIAQIIEKVKTLAAEVAELKDKAANVAAPATS